MEALALGAASASVAALVPAAVVPALALTINLARVAAEAADGNCLIQMVVS